MIERTDPDDEGEDEDEDEDYEEDDFGMERPARLEGDDRRGGRSGGGQCFEYGRICTCYLCHHLPRGLDATPYAVSLAVPVCGRRCGGKGLDATPYADSLAVPVCGRSFGGKGRQK